MVSVCVCVFVGGVWGRNSLRTSEGAHFRLGSVLLQVLAQGRGSVERRPARVAQVLGFACGTRRGIEGQEKKRFAVKSFK